VLLISVARGQRDLGDPRRRIAEKFPREVESRLLHDVQIGAAALPQPPLEGSSAHLECLCHFRKGWVSVGQIGSDGGPERRGEIPSG
jgi:hypothetical protein